MIVAFLLGLLGGVLIGMGLYDLLGGGHHG
jgi:hypothetical protein